MSTWFHHYATLAGLETNAHGGVYAPGKAYSIEKKIELANAYFELLESTGEKPSGRALAKAVKVSPTWALKVVDELLSDDGLIDPNHQRPQRLKGPGAKTIDSLDMLTLVLLLRECPSRTLSNYQTELFNRTGTLVSISTLHRFWKDGFDTKANLRKTDKVPIDKCKPENIQRAIEYIQLVLSLDHNRIKFGDEKLLKAAEIFNKRVRRDPITGEVSPVITDPDFRNTHTIIGFCGVDPRSYPMFFNINDGTNDSTAFATAIEEAILSAFLLPGDVLVLDNASIHVHGENSVLEDWLWDNFNIHLLMLPARCPELNPIEKLWSVLVARLKQMRILGTGADRSAHCAAAIVNEFTTDLVKKMYRKCGYNV